MISVLMPTYNQAEFLQAALDSVGMQDIPSDLEIIACDDGSTDDTAAILRANNIRTITHETNLGTASAINSAFEASTGEIVTWISSDNIMHRDWLRLLMSAMHDRIGVVYSAFWYERPDRRPQMLFQPYDPSRLINNEACYIGPSFLIRRSVWEQAGPHRGKISHDMDHWLRVEESCWRMGLKIIGLETPLCRYRAHDKRVTVTRAHEYDAPFWMAEARKRRKCV